MTRTLAVAIAAFLGVGLTAAVAANGPNLPQARVATPPPDYHPLKDDAALLDALDLSRPELARVAALHRKGETEAALAALVAHFRHRERPVPPDVPKSPGLAAADEIAAGRIKSVGGFPPFTVKLPYEWEANPYGDAETVVSLSRQSFVTMLVAAYRQSGNDRYLRSAIAYVEDWIRGSREARYLQGSELLITLRIDHWMPRAFWLNTARRLSGPWLHLFFVGRQSDVVSDGSLLTLLRMIHNQADFVLAAMILGDNRTATAANALAGAAILFPEFRRSGAWRDAAWSALRTVADQQFAPDGVHIEMAPHYALVTLRSLGGPILLGQRNGEAPDPQLLAVIERGLDYLVGVSDPLRGLPVLKHSDRTPLPPLLRPFLPLFPQRSDFAFVASNGKQGAPPAYRSRVFPYAGHAVFRSGWDRNAVHLIMDAGPMGRQPHEDKLGLELHAFGTPLIADPGRHSYNMAPIDRYIWSSKAHSVVLVDGHGQDRARCPKATWRPDRPTGIALRRNADGEAASGQFRGPWKSRAEVVHRRDVHFIQNRIFVVVDRLTPLDGRAHAYEGRFQLAEGEAGIHNGRVVFRSENGRAGLVIARLSSAASAPPDIVKGVKEPPGGWISPKYGTLVAAPSVRYAAAGAIAGPVTFVTVLMPFRGDAVPGVALDWSSDSDRTAVRLRVTVNSLETKHMLPLSQEAGNDPSAHVGHGFPCTP